MCIRDRIQDGKATYYTTNRVTADDKLVERLLAAGVEFGQVVPEEMSPIISFLVSWVLPLVIFYGLGSFMFRKMSQRMGGNTMSFGDVYKRQVVGLAGWERGRVFILPDAQAAEQAELPQKALVVAQTTIRRDRFDSVLQVLRRRVPDLTQRIRCV